MRRAARNSAQFGAILLAILTRRLLLPRYTPLHLTCDLGFSDVCRELLEAKARVDAALPDGSTALYLAAQNKRADCAHLLLQHNAAVDCLNSQRATPLYVASLRGDELTVDLLLAAAVGAAV